MGIYLLLDMLANFGIHAIVNFVVVTNIVSDNAPTHTCIVWLIASTFLAVK